MTEVFISYARANEEQAKAVAEALRDLGYSIWRDDELPAHRAYSDVIEERLAEAKAVVVIWSAEAAKSHWVRAEADSAREAGKLVQLRVDASTPPIPFNQIQCADLAGWDGSPAAPGWQRVIASLTDLAGTGGQVAAASAEPAPPPALPTKASIAVLPLANLSSDPEQDYFADGMTEEIVTALARSKSLFVVGSGSTMALKGKAVAAPEVARQLGVRYLLDGSVRKAGDRVRIAVRLTDAAGGRQVWSDRFDDTLEDVFALQDKVALSVAGVIEPAVQDAEIRRAAQSPRIGSYDLYLRSVPLFRMFRRAEMFQALDLLNRALAEEPDFPPALAAAATCHAQIIQFEWADDLDYHRRHGLELAERALQVGGDEARTLAQAAAALRYLDRSLDRAAAVIDRAAALNPGSAFVWFVSGMIRAVAGEPEQAIEHLERATRLDPLAFNNARGRAWMAVARFEQRRFDEALSHRRLHLRGAAALRRRGRDPRLPGAPRRSARRARPLSHPRVALGGRPSGHAVSTRHAPNPLSRRRRPSRNRGLRGAG